MIQPVPPSNIKSSITRPAPSHLYRKVNLLALPNKKSQALARKKVPEIKGGYLSGAHTRLAGMSPAKGWELSNS